MQPSRSLASFANAALLVAAVALVLGAVVVAAGFSQLLDARRRIFDVLQPALVQSQRLEASLVGQETGLRGFGLTRDPRLLLPYDAGGADEIKIETRLRELFAHDETSSRLGGPVLAALDAAVDRWRTQFAEPLIAHPGSSTAEQVFADAQVAFAAVRSEVAHLQAVVDTARAQSRHQLDTATQRLAVAIGIAVSLLAITSFGGAWLLRRRVVQPLARLVDVADRVADDRFGETITIEGPREIERLAERVDEMRSRIVGELAAAVAAKITLDGQAQELARSNSDLEQFAYVASHDLQEPLRKVASFCQLLEQRYGDQLDERGLTYIGFAVDGAKRMQALISDLLDFSRVGHTTESFEVCNLDEIVAAVLDRLEEAVGDAVIRVAPLPHVLGDPVLYDALLQNLVGNAVKYRRLDVPLEVDLTVERSGGLWTFSCLDNGIGIEPRFREQVFVIFQRLHGRDAFVGTGIGLALCKKIVEFSGGRIWIDDPPGDHGTMLRWTLPAIGEAAAPTTA